MSDFVMNHGSSEKHTSEYINHPFYIWLYWVLANSIGELIGLGSVFLIATGIVPGIKTYLGQIADLIIAGMLIVVGTLVEGTVLGTIQWIVIQLLNEKIKWMAWVNATLIGLFVAWALGSIPSTLIDFGTQGIKSTFSNSNITENYLTVGGMGLILGAVIGLPQWLLLRLYFNHTDWWIPASSLAWLVGMVVLFMGIDFTSRFDEELLITSVLFVTLIIAGALVGAIHGIALLQISPQPPENDPDHYSYSID